MVKAICLELTSGRGNRPEKLPTYASVFQIAISDP